MRIIFYSSVASRDFFNTQSFYSNDIEVLRDLGHSVLISNRISDFLYFWRYDISFLYFYRKSLAAALISRLFNKRVFFTGGIDSLNKAHVSISEYFLQSFLFNLCYLFSSCCFIVSNSDLANARESLIFRNNKLYLSFHPIKFAKLQLNKYESRKDDFISICWMGSINNVKRKGLDKAIYLFNDLLKSSIFVNSSFHIIGFLGSGYKYLQDIVVSLKLTDKVFFHGSVSDSQKISFLTNNKYYFQLSVYEGFGVAALEALSLGCCVVHTNNGGLYDTIGDNGIILDELISKSNFDLLAKRISGFRPSEDLSMIKNRFSFKNRAYDFSINGLQ